MKKLLLLALLAMIMVGCEYSTNAEIEERKQLKGFNVVVIDSCEYLKASNTRGYSGYGYFAHKGNCRFCIERQKKMIKEQIDSALIQKFD